MLHQPTYLPTVTYPNQPSSSPVTLCLLLVWYPLYSPSISLSSPKKETATTDQQPRAELTAQYNIACIWFDNHGTNSFCTFVRSLVAKQAVESPHALLVASFGVVKRVLLQTIPPRACLTALNFSQPFLINRAIRLSQEPITHETTQVGYGLIGAYFFVYVGIAVCLIRSPLSLPLTMNRKLKHDLNRSQWASTNTGPTAPSA